MTKLYAGAEWIGPAHSENYFSGRIGYGFYDRGKQYSITAIGLHHTATTLQGAIDTFKAAPASGRQHSAHFIVDLDGTRYQMLDTNDTAFALGDEVANCYTVNIEIVQTWDFGANVKTSDFTDAQYTSVSELCGIVAADNGFPADADHIHGHNYWTPTACPGDLDIARIIAPVPAKRRLPEMLFPRDPASGVIYAYDPLAKTARALTSIEWAACEAAGAQSGDMKDADAVALLKGLPAPSAGGGSGGGAKPTKLTGTITGELS